MLFPSTIIVTATENKTDIEVNRLIKGIGQQNTPNNPDIFRLDQTTGWGIDAVRSVRHFFSTKPFNHPSKLVIIFQAQNLQVEAQNALLKSLEEPGENHYFILITDNPQLLLPTIISRCHLICLQTGSIKAQDHFHLSAKLQDNFFTSEELAADKENLPKILQEQLNFYHRQFLTDPSIKNSILIEKLIKVIQMTKSNVDPKSALDYFFLNL